MRFTAFFKPGRPKTVALRCYLHYFAPGGYMEKQSYSADVFSAFEREEKRLSRQAEVAGKQDLELLLKHGLSPDHKVLDLGCGNGQIAAMVSQYLTTGSITGLDLNPEFISAAKVQHHHSNLSFREGSAYQLEALPGFDFIYSRFLFQHLSDPSLALQQVYRCLTPGGRCCIIDVNDDWLFLDPRLPEFSALVEAGATRQQFAGGNRRIAASLPRLFHINGFEKINADVIPFTSNQVGMETFLDLTLSFRANMAPELMPLYKRVQETVLAAPEKWFAMMGVFVITATKPLE